MLRTLHHESQISQEKLSLISLTTMVSRTVCQHKRHMISICFICFYDSTYNLNIFSTAGCNVSFRLVFHKRMLYFISEILLYLLYIIILT